MKHAQEQVRVGGQNWVSIVAALAGGYALSMSLALDNNG